MDFDTKRSSKSLERNMIKDLEKEVSEFEIIGEFLEEIKSLEEKMKSQKR